jgi:putative Holliday junction resolvase
MRYLGLDIGERNIGVAVGEMLARELTTIRAGKKKSFYDSPELGYSEIKRLIGAEQVDALVVGLPVNEAGELTSEARKISTFADGLAASTNKQIHFVNETLTSFMAKDLLADQGLVGRAADERVDQLAAQLILQQYLEENASA